MMRGERKRELGIPTSFRRNEKRGSNRRMYIINRPGSSRGLRSSQALSRHNYNLVVLTEFRLCWQYNPGQTPFIRSLFVLILSVPNYLPPCHQTTRRGHQIDFVCHCHEFGQESGLRSLGTGISRPRSILHITADGPVFLRLNDSPPTSGSRVPLSLSKPLLSRFALTPFLVFTELWLGAGFASFLSTLPKADHEPLLSLSLLVSSSGLNSPLQNISTPRRRIRNEPSSFASTLTSTSLQSCSTRSLLWNRLFKCRGENERVTP